MAQRKAIINTLYVRQQAVWFSGDLMLEMIQKPWMTRQPIQAESGAGIQKGYFEA